MAYTPKHVPSFTEKILSGYISNINITQGMLVDIDTTDVTAINGSYDYSALALGSVKLATVTTASTSNAGLELGVAMVNVTPTGASLAERILGLSTNFQTIPQGLNLPILTPAKGDIIGSDQYVGNLPGDSSALGKLDPTITSNLGAPLGIYQGRFRLAQSGDALRAQFVGTSTLNGNPICLFRFL